MKSIIKDILIGFIIGLGKIIPGVSGSVLAITLGVYEKIINSINNIFKDTNHIYYLSKVGIGIIISIVFFSRVITYCLSNYYTYTIFIFIGLILGSMKEITTNTKLKYWFLTLISFFIIVLLGLININSSTNTNTTIYYLLSGFIESISSIVPGVSGTSLLMLIGMYKCVIDIFSNILSINYWFTNIGIIIPFIIGLIIGLIISVKLISFLFNKYKIEFYNIILGLLIGSVFIMVKSCSYNTNSIIISIILLLISYIGIKKVNHFF